MFALQLCSYNSKTTSDIEHHETGVTGLSCGIVFEILRLAVLIRYRLVTDRRARDDSKYRASIASCG